MNDHEKIRDAVLAARDRLPHALDVEDASVHFTTDGDGGEVVRVRLILNDAPAGGFGADAYWAVSQVLDDLVRPIRPDALVLPGFVTRADLGELEAGEPRGSGAGSLAGAAVQ